MEKKAGMVSRMISQIAGAILLTFLVFCLPAGSAAQSGTQGIDERVSALISMMMKQKTEHKAFSDLEALGCSAVPAIVKQMDDRRVLPDPSISLVNKSPNPFEGLRHYGPEKVVDALAAILNQLTGQDFGFIYNGATDVERDKAVHGWREYVEKTGPDKLCFADEYHADIAKR
jgi:hypothetical protein